MGKRVLNHIQPFRYCAAETRIFNMYGDDAEVRFEMLLINAARRAFSFLPSFLALFFGTLA